MSEHDHSHHGHEHPARPSTPAVTEDAGSQALSEALRSSFGVVKFAMIIMLVAFFARGIFTVGPQERAVVLHFGKPKGEGAKVLLSPGLYWSWPYPIDEVVKIPITEIQTVKSTVGWYQTTPEQEFAGTEPPPGGSLNPAADGYAITADGNIIHTRATLLYRIDDPVHFVFDFVSASNAVQSALDNSLLYAASRYKVDDILTRDIAGFREAVQARMSQLVADEKLGIVIEQCQVESRPPRQLKAAFENVLTAVSIRDKVRSDAQTYENQVLSRASAEAATRTNIAEAERNNLVQSVKAESERFNDLLPKYQANPSLFVNLLLTETISKVLTNVQDKVYLPERADGKTRELRLQLNREPQKPTSVIP